MISLPNLIHELAKVLLPAYNFFSICHNVLDSSQFKRGCDVNID